MKLHMFLFWMGKLTIIKCASMRIRRPSICCKINFSDYKNWKDVFMGQDQRLPSFRKKPNKMVPVEKSDLDANSNLATANDSWEWSIGIKWNGPWSMEWYIGNKSLDEPEKFRVISCN